MNGFDFKRKLRSGQVCLGMWSSLTDPIVPEVISHLGYDWLLMDTEHAPIPLDKLQTMILMTQRGGAPAIVRPPWNDLVMIKQALDLGAEGLLIPMVNSGEQARQAVAAAKYPPVGRRGWGPRAAADFGRRTDAYAEEANDRLAVLVQIEHIDAVRNLDDILAVPGIDGVYIGPGDLSYSLGIGRQWQHPDLIAVIQQVIGQAKAAGVPVGADASGPLDHILRWLGYGAQFVTIGEDVGYLVEAASARLAAVRARLPEAT